MEEGGQKSRHRPCVAFPKWDDISRIVSQALQRQSRVFREEIPKGNFSIRLKNVQTADKGEYMCEVHTEKSVSSATVEIGRLGKSSEADTILSLY